MATVLPGDHPEVMYTPHTTLGISPISVVMTIEIEQISRA